MLDQKFKTLLKIAEVKNFTTAANELGLTQPAASQHIKVLEDEYNIKIFNKANKELKITEEGQVLIKYAKRIASLYKELELKIDDERKQKKSLVVGVSHTSESNAIAEVLATYCAKNKGTRIKIISNTIKNLYDKLQSYEIDLAIVEGVIPSKKYNSLLLDTDSLVAVLANDNHLANNKIININDLKNENLILRSTNSQTTALFEASLNNVNLSLNDFNVILELDNIATIKDLVSHNRGISILPKSACYHEIKNNTLQIRPIANFNMSRQINLIFPKNFEYEYILNDIVSIYNNLVH